MKQRPTWEVGNSSVVGSIVGGRGENKRPRFDDLEGSQQRSSGSHSQIRRSLKTKLRDKSPGEKDYFLTWVKAMKAPPQADGRKGRTESFNKPKEFSHFHNTGVKTCSGQPHMHAL
ncbi:hypothetical protein HAX54_029056, partial [Datura stramonium]|nr:hypothetical protein [Datura stramonium]